MKFQAIYYNGGRLVRTGYYSTREAAQDALMKLVGRFDYLTQVAVDLEEPAEPCWTAPRNGGLVSVRAKRPRRGP